MKKYNLLLISLLVACGCGSNSVSSKVSSSLATSSEEKSSVITSTDTVAPTIYGVKNFNFMKGSLISSNDLKDGVYAIDDVDGRIDKISLQIRDYYTDEKLTVIDIDNAGKYKLIFSASDKAGNKASKSSVMRIGQPDINKNNDGSTKTKWGSGYEYDYNAIQPSYELVFEDNFDGNGDIDKNKWGFDLGRGVNGWGNGELQYYTDRSENVSRLSGKLRIGVIKENYKGANYTSARVKTNESFLYGKFEIRAHFPSGGKGTWPAIWLLPKDPIGSYGVWPNSGEIDLMESSGNYHFNHVVQTLHRAKLQGSNAASSTVSNKIRVEGLYDDYHTYTLEWLPDLIIMSIDGVESLRFTASNLSNPTYKEWPYDIDYQLIINYAIGSWDTQGMGGKVDDSIFANEDISMYIDYVRVYQSPIVTNLYPTK